MTQLLIVNFENYKIFLKLLPHRLFMLNNFFVTFWPLHKKYGHWGKTSWNRYNLHNIFAYYLENNYSYIMSSSYIARNFFLVSCNSPLFYLFVCLAAYLCFFVCLFGCFSVFCFSVFLFFFFLFLFACMSFLSVAVLWTFCWKHLFSNMREQHLLSYHLIYVSWGLLPKFRRWQGLWALIKTSLYRGRGS